MKPYFVLLICVLLSCASKENSGDKQSNTIEKKLSKTEEKKDTLPSETDWKKMEQDSVELQQFWQQVVFPILKRDKQTVLNNMDFPVLGHWTRMMDMDKEPEDATREDFEKVYDRFFCNDFTEILSKQSKPGKYTINDKVWFGFAVGDGVSSVLLVFDKVDESFKLKEVHGIGGDFYETR